MTDFKTLCAIDVSDKLEKRKVENQTELSYLSWVWAWESFKTHCPDANYTIHIFENNLPYVYDENTGYMVFTSVCADGITHEMWLPVMDSKHKAMKNKPYEYKTRYGNKTVDAATMFDINKTIMRCLVKNIAMFGLGLSVYAGEDIPQPDNNDLLAGLIGAEEKEKLKSAIGLSKWAEEMNNCGGKMTFAKYYELMNSAVETLEDIK